MSDVSRRRPVLADVAEAAGVSKMTASRAISGEGRVSAATRQRVLQEADRLGYRPSLSARSLRSNRTNLLGVFSPSLTMPLQVEVVAGAREAASREGYRLLLDVDESHAGLRSPFASDGDLLIATPKEAVSGDPRFDVTRTVALMLDTPSIDSCVTNLDGATFEALRHLESRGYRRAALMVYGMSPALSGYAQGIQTFELPEDPGLVKIVGYDDESVVRAMQELMRLPERPDALVVVNVAATPVAFRFLLRSGMRIGREFGFVGTEKSRGDWGDLLAPPLTSIRVPGYDIGAAGARRLLERINGDRSPAQRHEFPAELRVRESTRGRP